MSNAVWVIVDFAIFIFTVYLCVNKFKIACHRVIPNQRTSYNGIIVSLILFFCLYNKTEGDYFHYESLLEELTSTAFPSSHMEYPYMAIIGIIGNFYLLFRLIVWGTALLFVYKLLKENLINNSWGWLCFVLFSLIAFGYVRASLGIAMFYYGYTLILKRRNFISVLVGLIFIILSISFHKSIILLVAFSILFCVININIVFVILSLLCFPILIKILNNGIVDILLTFGSVKGMRYFVSESQPLGSAMKIQIYIVLLSIGIILLSFMYNTWKKNIMIDRITQKYFNYIYSLCYVSIVLMSFNYGANDIITRAREMGYIPLALFVGRTLKYNNYIPTSMICGIVMFFIADIYYFFYMYYLKLLGAGI